MAENIICVMACLVLLEDFMLLKEHVLKERFFVHKNISARYWRHMQHFAADTKYNHTWQYWMQ